MGAGHAHGPKLAGTPEANRSKERAIGIAALLTGGFMGAEVVGGLVSGSLALLADAGHMLTDFASLVLAWFAFRLARRPADWKTHLRLRPLLRSRRARERAEPVRHRHLDLRRGVASLERADHGPGRV